jgi:hypothetical protein
MCRIFGDLFFDNKIVLHFSAKKFYSQVSAVAGDKTNNFPLHNPGSNRIREYIHTGTYHVYTIQSGRTVHIYGKPVFWKPELP